MLINKQSAKLTIKISNDLDQRLKNIKDVANKQGKDIDPDSLIEKFLAKQISRVEEDLGIKTPSTPLDASDINYNLNKETTTKEKELHNE